MKNNAIPKSKAKTAYGVLSEVRALILQEPKRYDQSTWVRRINTVHLAKDRPACNTIACVGGWVAMLMNIDTTSSTICDAAKEVLGLHDHQAFALFDGQAVTGDVGTDQYATAGARHIRTFQKRYAKQLKAQKVRS